MRGSFLLLLAASAAFAAATEKTAPGFRLEALDSRQMTLGGLLDAAAGKPVLLSFFATWCEPCLKELPMLKQLEASGKVKVVMVSEDDPPVSAIKEFVAEHNISLPVLVDKTGAVGKEYGVVHGATVLVPMSFLVGPDGTQFWDHSGFNPALKEDVDQAVASWDQRRQAAMKSVAPAGSVWLYFTGSGNGLGDGLYDSAAMRGREGFLKKDLPFHSPHILVDVGDNLPPRNDPAGAEAAAKVVALTPYDALVPGDQEFMSGREPPLAADRPYLAANLKLCAEGDCVQKTPGYKVMESNGLKIALIGIVGEEAFASTKKSISVADPVAAVRSALVDLKGKVDVIIVLSHAGLRNDRRLAKKVSGIDLIVGGHSQEALSQPLKEGRTWIVNAGGASVGRLLLGYGKSEGAALTSFDMLPLQDSSEGPESR